MCMTFPFFKRLEFSASFGLYSQCICQSSSWQWPAHFPKSCWGKRPGQRSQLSTRGDSSSPACRGSWSCRSCRPERWDCWAPSRCSGRFYSSSAAPCLSLSHEKWWTRQKVEGGGEMLWQVKRGMERVIENMKSSNNVQLLTLMTRSVCVQREEVFLMACLHLIPLFQAEET